MLTNLLKFEKSMAFRRCLLILLLMIHGTKIANVPCQLFYFILFYCTFFLAHEFVSFTNLSISPWGITGLREMKSDICCTNLCVPNFTIQILKNEKRRKKFVTISQWTQRNTINGQSPAGKRKVPPKYFNSETHKLQYLQS